MRRLQRRWNRRKRFSSGGEIPGTSLANVNLRGGIDSRSLSRPLSGLNCDVRLPEMCHRLCEKGDRSFIWKSMQRIQESWVNIRLPLISFISFLPHIGFWSNLGLTESCFQGESNATYGEAIGEELMENVRSYCN